MGLFTKSIPEPAIIRDQITHIMTSAGSTFSAEYISRFGIAAKDYARKNPHLAHSAQFRTAVHEAVESILKTMAEGYQAKGFTDDKAIAAYEAARHAGYQVLEDIGDKIDIKTDGKNLILTVNGKELKPVPLETALNLKGTTITANNKLLWDGETPELPGWPVQRPLEQAAQQLAQPAAEATPEPKWTEKAHKLKIFRGEEDGPDDKSSSKGVAG